MRVFENRWKTKEASKELANQFLTVAKQNEKELAIPLESGNQG